MLHLNEILINPPGNADAPWQFVELLCTKKASLADYYFAVIDGDLAPGKPATIDLVVPLASYKCGDNGLALIKAPGGHPTAAGATEIAIPDFSFETKDATASFVVIKSPTPITKGTSTIPATLASSPSRPVQRWSTASVC